MLEEIEAGNLLENARRRGEQIGRILSDLAGRFGLGHLRGSGLLRAFDLPTASAFRLVDVARSHGLLLNAPRPSTIRLMPPLNVSGQEVEEFGDRLVQALESSR